MSPAAFKKAKDAGASRTTLWRIKSGKQKKYSPWRGKNPKIQEIAEEIPKEWYDSAIKGTFYAWPELAKFDRDDLVQEAVITAARHMVGKKIPQEKEKQLRYVFYIAVNKAREARERGSSSLGRKWLIRAGDVTTISPQLWGSFNGFEYDFKTEDEAQKILNENDGELYLQFAKMRRKEIAKCQKCGNDMVKLTIHHIIPRKIKTINTRQNTAVLCRGCHDEIEFVYAYAEEKIKPRKPDWQELFSAWKKKGTDALKDENR